MRLAGRTAAAAAAAGRRCRNAAGRRCAGEAPAEGGVLQLGRQEEERHRTSVLRLVRETRFGQPVQTVVHPLGRTQAGRRADRGGRRRLRGASANGEDDGRRQQAAGRQEKPRRRLPGRDDQRRSRAVYRLLGLVQEPGGEEGRPVRRSQEH